MRFRKPTDDSRQPAEGHKNYKPQTVKLIATIVLSALVGAGSTLAVLEFTGNLTSAYSVVDSSVSPVSVSTSTNTSDNGWVSTVVKAVEPSVVAVVNYTSQQSTSSDSSEEEASDVGTGFLFNRGSKYGYFVTNNHVVEGSAKVELVLASGKHVPGKVVGTDEFTDLAVISVADKYLGNMQPLQFASSKNLQVGEPVVTIGTPEGLDFVDSVSSGIISGAKRTMPVEDPNNSDVVYDYQPAIQTDAPINPGNSGGPLLNSSGQVLGVTSSKIVASGVENMGFAIPSEEVVQIANQLLENGHAVHTALGISAEDVDQMMPYGPNVPVSYGVYVASVSSSEAKAGGLKKGDVIISINGQKVEDSADLRTVMFQLSPGQTVTLKVYRGNNLHTLRVKTTQMQTPNDTSSNSNSETTQGNPYSGSGESPFGSYSGGQGSNGEGSGYGSNYSSGSGTYSSSSGF